MTPFIPLSWRCVWSWSVRPWWMFPAQRDRSSWHVSTLPPAASTGEQQQQHENDNYPPIIHPSFLDWRRKTKDLEKTGRTGRTSDLNIGRRSVWGSNQWGSSTISLHLRVIMDCVDCWELLCLLFGCWTQSFPFREQVLIWSNLTQLSTSFKKALMGCKTYKNKIDQKIFFGLNIHSVFEQTS